MFFLQSNPFLHYKAGVVLVAPLVATSIPVPHTCITYICISLCFSTGSARTWERVKKLPAKSEPNPLGFGRHIWQSLSSHTASHFSLSFSLSPKSNRPFLACLKALQDKKYLINILYIGYIMYVISYRLTLHLLLNGV